MAGRQGGLGAVGGAGAGPGAAGALRHGAPGDDGGAAEKGGGGQQLRQLSRQRPACDELPRARSCGRRLSANPGSVQPCSGGTNGLCGAGAQWLPAPQELPLRHEGPDAGDRPPAAEQREASELPRGLGGCLGAGLAAAAAQRSLRGPLLRGGADGGGAPELRELCQYGGHPGVRALLGVAQAGAPVRAERAGGARAAGGHAAAVPLPGQGLQECPTPRPVLLPRQQRKFRVG
mmetsp:Transcript_39332/g.93958  ORF Transcript_39332/g.93958 Transcript_39332/m.93958 type:complete len:233 (+) Transcript_39332:701-1399(+)